MADRAVACVHLSDQARALWGKSDRGEGRLWLPLHVHLADTAYVMARLWEQWLPESTRRTIARATGGDESLAESLLVLLAAVHDLGKATPAFQAKRLAQGPCASLAWKPEQAGLPVPRGLAERTAPTHAVAGEVILERYLTGLGWDDARAIAAIVGSHHGTFPSAGRVVDARAASVELYGTSSPGSPWQAVQRELADAALAMSGLAGRPAPDVHVIVPVASTIAGVLTMADWIASDERAFGLIPLSDDGADAGWLERRERDGWSRLGLAPSWHEPCPPTGSAPELLAERFGLPADATPRPVQAAALRIARETADPGLMVVEAPMGEGKTEAALLAAEALAARTGAGGVCVALPTMATTDAMFGRVEAWLERLPHGDGTPDRSVCLAHGKAMLDERFRGIVRGSRTRSSDGTVALEWTCGRRRGMLANFCVCTVDQVLMGALCMRHLPLRQLAIQNKVVVIDECHAYDAYMRQYLETLLGWLGCWHVPAILLSATLPPAQRDAFVDVYLDGRRASGHGAPGDGRPAWKRAAVAPPRPDAALDTAYPVITYTAGDERRSLAVAPSGRSVRVCVQLVDDGLETLADTLSGLLAGGGCAGVVCDTVARAQDAASALAEAFGEDAVVLDHSRFMDADRMEAERRLRESLGPDATVGNGRRPCLCIVVGTQVLEQSLDIDFDILVTDVAPVDLMFQRMGRLHRHRRGDGGSDCPEALREARCLVRGVIAWDGGVPRLARGVDAVYERASLLEAMAVMGLDAPGARTVEALPADVAPTVRLAYSDDVAGAMPCAWLDAYAEACARRDRDLETMLVRSRACRIADARRASGRGLDLTTLSGAGAALRGRDDDRDARAVRDTQETVEVLLVRRADGDGIALLPWVGGGAMVPTDREPDGAVTQALMRSAVRLPASVCPPHLAGRCAAELEERGRHHTAAWQGSRWLRGRLLLVMDETGPDAFSAEVMGRRVRYTRHDGMSVDDASSSLQTTTR